MTINVLKTHQRTNNLRTIFDNSRLKTNRRRRKKSPFHRKKLFVSYKNKDIVAGEQCFLVFMRVMRTFVI